MSLRLSTQNPHHPSAQWGYSMPRIDAYHNPLLSQSLPRDLSDGVYRSKRTMPEFEEQSAARGNGEETVRVEQSTRVSKTTRAVICVCSDGNRKLYTPKEASRIFVEDIVLGFRSTLSVFPSTYGRPGKYVICVT